MSQSPADPPKGNQLLLSLKNSVHLDPGKAPHRAHSIATINSVHQMQRCMEREFQQAKAKLFSIIAHQKMPFLFVFVLEHA